MDVCLACQSILDGSGHVYYALAVAWVAAAFLTFYLREYWYLGFIMSIMITGVAVDLFAHGYTH